jgi:tetratricopeptide (TPR) repeat protein
MDLGADIGAVAAAIGQLEADLGLRLDAQTALLGTQVTMLEQIAETLRTPAKTRAAERLEDAGELLRRERWTRALTVAEEAIDADPNNPAGFIAAAWARLGLDAPEQARDSFVEAAAASDRDRRSAALRHAARLTLVVEGPLGALGFLSQVDETWGADERAAVKYDRAMYLAEAGLLDEAIGELMAAGAKRPRLLEAALCEPLLARHDTLFSATASELKRLHEEVTELSQEVQSTLDRFQARLMQTRDDVRSLRLGPEVTVDGDATIQEALSGIAMAHEELLTGRLTASLASLKQLEQDLESFRKSRVEARLRARDNLARRTTEVGQVLRSFRDAVERFVRDRPELQIVNLDLSGDEPYAIVGRRRRSLLGLGPRDLWRLTPDDGGKLLVKPHRE